MISLNRNKKEKHIVRSRYKENGVERGREVKRKKKRKICIKRVGTLRETEQIKESIKRIKLCNGFRKAVPKIKNK